MNRIRFVFNKRRRSDGGGSPSNPSREPPVSPSVLDQNQGNSSPPNTNELIPYPFTTRFHFVDEFKERERKFKNFTVLTPIFPDAQFMRDDLLILDDVKQYFDMHDMSFVFGEDPGVYEKVVLEFHCSFEPVFGYEEIGEDRFTVVRSWKFQLGGRAFSVDESDLRVALGLQRHDGCVPVPKSVRNHFWMMISKSDVDYRAGRKATEIQLPIWKFVHRFIATCILLRTDEGRFVNTDDLAIMSAMHENVDFDPLLYITRSLEECHQRSFRGRYLSGGHFVTRLARFVGFSLDPAYELPRRTLGESELVSRGLVRRMIVQGAPMYFVIGMDGTPGVPTRPARQGRQTRQPSQDRPGPSAPRTHSGSYEDVIRRLDDLTTYSYDMSTWHGDMMRGLYTQMGYSGYRSPPRPSFFSDPRTTAHAPMDTDFGDIRRDDYGVMDRDPAGAAHDATVSSDDDSGNGGAADYFFGPSLPTH